MNLVELILTLQPIRCLFCSRKMHFKKIALDKHLLWCDWCDASIHLKDQTILLN